MTTTPGEEPIEITPNPNDIWTHLEVEVLAMLMDAVEYSKLEYERIYGEDENATVEDIEKAKKTWEDRIKIRNLFEKNGVRLAGLV
jgi:hypothetical protein